MKILRPLIVLGTLTLIIITALLWWNRPVKVDMSSYVPADSLVYIEINSLPAITDAVQGTDAWKKVAAELALNNKAPSAAEMVIARSGLAPVRAVISSRAQMALVVFGIDTAEKDDSLRIKPDVAL